MDFNDSGHWEFSCQLCISTQHEKYEFVFAYQVNRVPEIFCCSYNVYGAVLNTIV